jgi:TRAP transporter TAXI family solute receptor
MKRFLLVLLLVFPLAPASAQKTQGSAERTQAYGIAAKRPVFAGACHYCPYGAIAEVVKAAMKPYGYDVQICYICASTIGPRQVAGALVPQRRERPPLPPGFQIMGPEEPVPQGPVDFGATNIFNLRAAYEGREGRGDYGKEGPRRNLRIFAVVDYPNYLLVAATKASGITDLAQLKGRKTPLRVVVDHDRSMEVLGYYGLTEESIKAAGGTVRDGAHRSDFDLVIFGGTLSNAPEQNIWYEITQKYDLVFLQMPDDLIAKLEKDPDYARRAIPLGLMRGVDRNIPTVARRAYVVFGRSDAPDEFAYVVARALDEQQDLWMWAPIPLYYNPRTAWKTSGLPLHPGAERYYHEKGYMSSNDGNSSP